MTYPSRNAWTDEQKNRIAAKLTEKGVRRACPMCGNPSFVLVDGYFSHPIQTDPDAGYSLGGPSIPTVVIACQNCGFISEHALGILIPGSTGGAK